VRRSLSLLVTAGLLPLVALGGTFGVIQLREQRREVREQAQAAANFAAALLQVRLDASVRAVQMVTQSPAFDGPLDVDRFRTLARRLVEGQPDWRILSIATPEGQRLLDVPFIIADKPGGPVVEMASLRRAVRTRTPAIGEAMRGPKGRLAFAVRAPVLRDGKVRYVVSAVTRAARLREILLFQPVPKGWRAAIVDGAGHDVVSVPDQPGSVGSAEEESVTSTWAPVAGTTWRIRVSTPAEALARPRRNAILILSAAAAASILLIGLLARLLASEIAQMRKREAGVLQSQRMEALGRLTGGVAHDFNNLLTPIIGGLDLIGRHTDDARIRRYVEAAAVSAERAKSLVGRLLAFSRRQSLSPKPVDLAALLRGMFDLIDRSLTPAIRIEVDIPGELPPALADPGQLELAILNLAINARDAMPAGGRLRISANRASAEDAAGLPPGAYLRIDVSDTGEGMDEHTLHQAIDPFFTTKTAEKGTGLGLSMVHGFAAQSGGALRLASVIGQGTSATIILPESAEAEIDGVDPAPGPEAVPGRVLLVDDDEAVRRVAAEILREAGQEVLEAANVEEALGLLQRETDLDALITDFVMPGRSGGELIAEVRTRWPHLPILLVTGFVSETGMLPHDIPKVMKPFEPAALIQALAQLRATPLT
jgi:signal transduction histidine kinase